MRELVIVLLAVSVPLAYAAEYEDLGVRVDTIAENLRIPWSIDWISRDTVLFTERGGNLRIIQDGKLADAPLLSLGVAGVEGGMLGVAVDPDHAENGFVYLYYTYSELVSTSNRVVRYHFSDGTLTEDRVLIDGIPGGPFHDGGRIQFGPDGKLYVTTGDAGNPGLSQDMDSLAGKILRINPDGTIPEDNPWEGSPVYSVGHRNPQGIDWDHNGNLIATDHGPSGWGGNGHDEINLVAAGANYGWPDIIGDETAEGLQSPLLHSGTDVWAPSGAEFYDAEKIPHWSGKYFVAALRGAHLHMIEMDDNTVISSQKIFQDDFGRLRDVQTGPDGYLYVLTSNRDGRGTPGPHDDRILRISPLDGCDMESLSVAASHERDGNATIITVTGCAGGDISEVGLQVTGPDGELVAEGTAVAEDGRFESILEVQNMADGTYSATVTAGGSAATQTFVVPEFGQILVILSAGIAAVTLSVLLGNRMRVFRV